MPERVSIHHWTPPRLRGRLLQRLALAVALVTAAGPLTMLATAVPASAIAPPPPPPPPPVDPGYFTSNGWTCPTGQYQVPSDVHYLQIRAVGAAGTKGPGSNGGAGGKGADVQAIVPVIPGQTLTVVVAAGRYPHGGVAPSTDDGSTGGGTGGGTSYVTTAKLDPTSYVSGCQSYDHGRYVQGVTGLTWQSIVVIAGGGGGGGGGGTSSAGGAGGDASEGGSAGYGDPNFSGCEAGYPGNGGSATTDGVGGLDGCPAQTHANPGLGFNGGTVEGDPLGRGGAGGGGWYGGGAGGRAASGYGASGGGSGSSHVRFDATWSQFTTATVDPYVKIVPVQAPRTEVLADGAPWTSATIPPTGFIVSAFDPEGGSARAYYAWDNPDCAPSNLAACTEFTQGSTPATPDAAGLHVLTYFGVSGKGVADVVHSKVVGVGLTHAAAASGIDPAASAGGANATPGSVTVGAAGTGVVGAGIDPGNWGGTPHFDAKSYVSAIALGALTRVGIKDCNLAGGTFLAWWDGAAWQLASSQTYDPATGCVTVTVDAATSPSLTQLKSHTVFSAGAMPTISGQLASVPLFHTWFADSVRGQFWCSPGASFTGTAPSAGWEPTSQIVISPYPPPAINGGRGVLTSEGANQVFTGSCADQFGHSASGSIPVIGIDRTPPTVSGTPSSAANAEGWYHAPVGVSFVGDDVLSGIESCSPPVTYSGPDVASTSVSGSCTDKAGNVGNGSFTLKYDATAPQVSYSGNEGTYTADQTVSITCSAGDNLSGVASSTCVDISGPAYTFAVGPNSFSAQATDVAGNVSAAATATFTVTVNQGVLTTVIPTLVTDPSVASTLQAQASSVATAPNANAKAGKLKAFTNSVNAQTGKSITPANAAILIALAKAL